MVGKAWPPGGLHKCSHLVRSPAGGPARIWVESADGGYWPLRPRGAGARGCVLSGARNRSWRGGARVDWGAVLEAQRCWWAWAGPACGVHCVTKGKAAGLSAAHRTHLTASHKRNFRWWSSLNTRSLREPAITPPVLIKQDLKIDVPPPYSCIINTIKELTGVEAGLGGSSPYRIFSRLFFKQPY